MERLLTVAGYLDVERGARSPCIVGTMTRTEQAMPYYEYRCGANGRTLEVRHPMTERLETWEELARAAGIELGSTAADAPVERLMSAPVPIASSGEATDFPGCGPGCACAPSA